VIGEFENNTVLRGLYPANTGDFKLRGKFVIKRGQREGQMLTFRKIGPSWPRKRWRRSFGWCPGRTL